MGFREIIGCLFSEWYEVHECILCEKCWIFWLLKYVVYIITVVLNISSGDVKYIARLLYGYPFLLINKLPVLTFMLQRYSVSQKWKWWAYRCPAGFSIPRGKSQTEAENNVSELIYFYSVILQYSKTLWYIAEFSEVTDLFKNKSHNCIFMDL
jgi:starvation-inducible outer membrane lipoprotein